MYLEPVKNAVANFHRGRRWIVTPGAAAAATASVDQLREWDAAGVMIVAGVEGIGDLPRADRFYYTRARGDTVMQSIRAFLGSVEHPSDDLAAAVDAFDPKREALVLGADFSRRSTLAGRPIYGARPEIWGALEDKTTVDRLWDDAGVTRAPSVVVSVDEATDAAGGLASELGTVWVADNTEGWHGGGEYARWVRSPNDIAPAIDWFAHHAVDVRVMPFLDGIPCSIHGFVTRDGVAVFLPVEMIILRHATLPEFSYAQAANFWNPPGGVRDAMREAARRVGTLLAERHGYLGGFGIDGVCTRNGFLPTELNPRLSVGHGLHSRAADLPLESIERMLIEGDIEINAADLEAFVGGAAQESRRGGVLLPLAGHHENARVGIRFIDGRAVAIAADGVTDATMEIGPAAMGSLIIMRFDPTRTPIGPSIAPRAVAAIDLARELWELDIPPLVPAPDLCETAGSGS